MNHDEQQLYDLIKQMVTDMLLAEDCHCAMQSVRDWMLGIEEGFSPEEIARASIKRLRAASTQTRGRIAMEYIQAAKVIVLSLEELQSGHEYCEIARARIASQEANGMQDELFVNTEAAR